jgi:hypothetical protein
MTHAWVLPLFRLHRAGGKIKQVRLSHNALDLIACQNFL